MSMSLQRREKILASLRAGHQICRFWSGRDTNGYLSHRLDGVKNLRESEVEALKAEGLIEFVGKGRVGRFPNLRLKAGVSASALTCRGANYHVFTLGADKCSVCGASR